MNAIAIVLSVVVAVLFFLAFITTVRTIRYSKSDECKVQDRIDRFVNREAA